MKMKQIINKKLIKINAQMLLWFIDVYCSVYKCNFFKKEKER